MSKKQRTKNNHQVVKSQNNNNLQVKEGFLQARFSSGPLPSPEILQKYNDVLPGLAERIVQQAEAQTAHRIDIETKVIKSDILNSKLGIIFAFILGVMGIGGGIYLAVIGSVIPGYIFSGGTLVSLVSTFIYGTRSRKKEREARRGK